MLIVAEQLCSDAIRHFHRKHVLYPEPWKPILVYPRFVFLLVVMPVSRGVGPTVGVSKIVHPLFRCLGLDYYVHIKLEVVIANPHFLDSIPEILAPSALRGSGTVQICRSNSRVVDQCLKLRFNVRCALTKIRFQRVVRAGRGDRFEAAEPDGEVRLLFVYSNKRSYVDTRESSIG